MVSDKQIKIIKSLKLKKNRIKHNLFVAEGDKTILELILADFKINSLYSQVLVILIDESTKLRRK
jgi:TrmH family RNA methyltransferase